MAWTVWEKLAMLKKHFELPDNTTLEEFNKHLPSGHKLYGSNNEKLEQELLDDHRRGRFNVEKIKRASKSEKQQKEKGETIFTEVPLSTLQQHASALVPALERLQDAITKAITEFKIPLADLPSGTKPASAAESLGITPLLSSEKNTKIFLDHNLWNSALTTEPQTEKQYGQIIKDRIKSALALATHYGEQIPHRDMQRTVLELMEKVPEFSQESFNNNAREEWQKLNQATEKKERGELEMKTAEQAIKKQEALRAQHKKDPKWGFNFLKEEARRQKVKEAKRR